MKDEKPIHLNRVSPKDYELEDDVAVISIEYCIGKLHNERRCETCNHSEMAMYEQAYQKFQENLRDRGFVSLADYYEHEHNTIKSLHCFYENDEGSKNLKRQVMQGR